MDPGRSLPQPCLMILQQWASLTFIFRDRFKETRSMRPQLPLPASSQPSTEPHRTTCCLNIPAPPASRLLPLLFLRPSALPFPSPFRATALASHACLRVLPQRTSHARSSHTLKGQVYVPTPSAGARAAEGKDTASSMPPKMLYTPPRIYFYLFLTTVFFDSV